MASALVVGGATGIGRAVVRGMRQRGDTVLIADIDGAGAALVAAETLPGRAAAVELDMAIPESAARAVEAAIEFAGGLDIVFGNAGVLKVTPLEEWTVEDWDRTIAVNLRAPFLLAKAATPHFRQQGGGVLLFTSSTGALRGGVGIPAYSASKAGLVNLARSLAAELSPDGIRVNTILPGWVETEFNEPYWSAQEDRGKALEHLLLKIPLRHQASPENIASVVLFLTSNDASYITGQAIVVDGGYSAI